MIARTSAVYIQAYETITGQPFEAPDPAEPVLERIRRNLQAYF
jgi:phosphoribosylaminoimidazole-succinocarboxamide synthase